MPASATTSDPQFEIRPGERQLFLDDLGIARLDNLARTMHQPAKRGAVIKPDRPWEFALQTRCAPAWDPQQKVFKIWMITSTTLPGVGGTTYAESEDGLHWTKPALGQCEINGSKQNNFVAVEPDLTWPANAIENVVYDARDPDPSRRYKGLGHCYGREPLVSPDGIHWRRLQVPPIPSSDESNLNIDPRTGAFIATLKTTPGGRRMVTLSTSKDFEHWPAPVLVFSADADDQALAREVIAARLADPTLSQPTHVKPADFAADVYNMPIFRYEGLYVGLPAIFYHTADEENDGFHHVQLICSRDLRDWRRLGERKPFIGPSPVGSGAYDLTQILPPSRPIARGDELWFYYTGIRYRCPPEDARDAGAVCLAVLRRDGFISLDAGEQEGSVLTRPCALPRGELHLNVDAADGRAVVQVCDESGAAIPGFEASAPITGDRLDAVVAWPAAKTEALAGRRVSFRIALRRAALYSYWIE